MKYLVYFIYQAEGRIEDYVPAFLSAVRARFDVIHVVFNGKIAPGEAEKLPMADRIQERDNDEFDVGAYKAAIFSNPDDYWESVDELTLANFTFFAPFGDMERVFDWAETIDADFWGLSAHKRMEPNPFTGKGVLPYHINSHWISVRRPMLQRPEFLSYWREMLPIRSYNDSVLIHESQFTRHFAEQGYRFALYLQDENYPSDYPAFNDVAQAVEEGFPILKRRLFYHTPTTYMDRYDVNVRQAMETAEANGLYDMDLVWDSVAGTVDPSVLYQNADLLHVLPDASSGISVTEEDPLQMVLVVSGPLDPVSVRRAAARINFPCRLHLIGDVQRAREDLVEALAGKPVEVLPVPVEDLASTFDAVKRISEAIGNDAVLFATLTDSSFGNFGYGMRQVARDAVVAHLARAKLADNRFFGLALPVIRTYGNDAETEFLSDLTREELLVDLARFNVKPKFEGEILVSTSGVFWARAGLLSEIAGEVCRYLDALPSFRDVDRGASKPNAVLSDGKEIDSFLSVGLPFFAAERRLITIVLSNTAEVARNFVKMESRYRAVSEKLGITDPFLLRNRIEYLLQFNTQEGRQVIWSEIFNQGFNNAWSKAYEKGKERGKAEAKANAQPLPPEEDLLDEVRRKAFEEGLATATKAATIDHRSIFDAGFNEGWRQGLQTTFVARNRARAARVLRFLRLRKRR